MNFLNMLLFLRHKFDGKFPEIHENHQSNSWNKWTSCFEFMNFMKRSLGIHEILLKAFWSVDHIWDVRAPWLSSRSLFGTLKVWNWPTFFWFRQYCFHFSKAFVSGSERPRLTNSTVCACSWMIWPVCLPLWRSIVYLINQSRCNKPWDWNAKHVQQKKYVNQIQILQAQVPIQVIDQAAAETVAKSRKLPPIKKQLFLKAEKQNPKEDAGI